MHLTFSSSMVVIVIWLRYLRGLEISIWIRKIHGYIPFLFMCTMFIWVAGHQRCKAKMLPKGVYFDFMTFVSMQPYFST